MKVIAEKITSKISAIFLLISIMTSWMIVPVASGFPMVAFFVFFVGLSSIVYFFRKKKTTFDTILYFGILLLSCFTIYRANEELQFLDFVFIIFFGSLLTRPLVHNHGVFTILFSPLIVIVKAFTSKNLFPYYLRVPEKYIKINYFREYLPTLAITTFVLLITVPLLASANPFFNALLQNTLKMLNLDWLFKLLFSDSLFVYVLRFTTFVTLLYFIPRVLTFSILGEKVHAAKQLFSINYLVPKLALAAVLIIFFITQLQLYFASSASLQSLGYTNSRLTNEVFAQVTIVAFIVFILAYFDKSRKVWNQRLTYFLIVEAFFLVGIAFKSVYDYSSLYGFTQKRLWGYTTMTWLTGALSAFVYHYTKQTQHLGFIKQIVSWTLGVLILVNVLNFDSLIYRYSKPTTPAGVDYRYLSTLSADAGQYKEVLIKAMSEAEKDKFSINDSKYMDPVYRIISQIEYLRFKYEKRKDINTFNFSEYQAYLDTKDINIAAYMKRITDTQQKYPQN